MVMLCRDVENGCCNPCYSKWDPTVSSYNCILEKLGGITESWAVATTYGIRICMTIKLQVIGTHFTFWGSGWGWISNWLGVASLGGGEDLRWLPNCSPQLNYLLPSLNSSADCKRDWGKSAGFLLKNLSNLSPELDCWNENEYCSNWQHTYQNSQKLTGKKTKGKVPKKPILSFPRKII